MAMMEMEQVKDAALKYDKPTLARLAQSGQLSPTLAVMAGMMRDRIVQSEMKPPSPPTVAEEVMQPMGQRMGLGAIAPGGQPQAPQQMPPQMPQQPQPQGQGLDQVPVPPQMFERQGMASGGIVAFQAGGGTPPPSFANMYSGLTPDLEALAAARRAYMGDFPTESAEDRRRELLSQLMVQFGGALASTPGGFAEGLGAGAKAIGPTIASGLSEMRKDKMARLAAERAEKGRVFEGVLSARGEAAKSAAAEGRLQKELTSREKISEADRGARITAANIAAGKPTDMRYYADMVVKAQQGDPKAKTIVAGIDKYLQQSALARVGVQQQGVDVQREKFGLDLLDKAVKYVDSQISMGGPEYTKYRQLQQKDKENAAKNNPTTLAEDFKTKIETTYINRVQRQKQAQPGAAPAGAQGASLPPPAAVSMLKANPSDTAKQQFDEIFGPGAAARALANK